MKLLRDVHLAVGLFCMPLLFVLALDGLRLSHPGWFSAHETTTHKTYRVRALTPEGIAHELELEHGLVGDLWPARDDGSFRIEGPMAGYGVRPGAQAGTVEVQTTRGGPIFLAHRLHVTAGIHHAHGSINLWGALAILVSGGLLVLAVSGLLLWLPRLKERRLGLAFLATSIGYCSLCLLLIRFA